MLGWGKYECLNCHRISSHQFCTSCNAETYNGRFCSSHYFRTRNSNGWGTRQRVKDWRNQGHLNNWAPFPNWGVMPAPGPDRYTKNMGIPVRRWSF